MLNNNVIFANFVKICTVSKLSRLNYNLKCWYRCVTCLTRRTDAVQCCQLGDILTKSGDFPNPLGDFYCKEWLATNLATFSGPGFCEKHVSLPSSASSGGCREHLPRPKALTGGQKCQSSPPGCCCSQRPAPLRVQAANESRMREAVAVPATQMVNYANCAMTSHSFSEF